VQKYRQVTDEWPTVLDDPEAQAAAWRATCALSSPTVLGGLMGAALAHGSLRQVHVVLNLLGLVGLVVA
jgi:hypothetical protein